MNSVNAYKCPSCGAPLEFQPATQNWKCNYCLTEHEKEHFGTCDTSEDSHKNMDELDSYSCKNCGAELIADSTTSATFCLYCKSPTIIKTRFSGQFRPKSVIPFRLTKEQAVNIYENMIKKCILAPNEFKRKEEIEKVTGIYAPFWLFDCKANGDIAGEATIIKTWRRGDYKYTQTKYFYISRKGNARYKKIPVDASTKLDDKFMHMIEPFNYSDVTDFSMKYMSGFMAEKYDVGSPDAQKVMKKRVEEYIESRLRSTVQGYSTYNIRSRQVSLADIEPSYSMLPIYLMINKYRGKDHVFIVNGQTGKVVGDMPISPIKQFLFAVIVFVIVWIIGVFGGALFV
ncbi:UNVERIFIED_CONTAM: replication restart DNA helicase PriA [Acetivibrio alkalicellulosi]